MSQVTQQTMKCSACGLKYPWSPQTAGRKIKCKCGTIFVAPASVEAGPARTPAPKVSAAVAEIAAARPAVPPVVAHADIPPMPRRAVAPAVAAVTEPVIDLEDDDEITASSDDLYDIADDVAAPPPLPAPTVAVGASAAPARAAGTGSTIKGKSKGNFPVLPGYSPKKIDDSDEKKAQIKKLLIPVIGIALLVGVVFAARQLVDGSQPDYTNLPGDDGEFQRIADRDGAFEARQWLEGNDSRGVVGFFWTRGKTTQMLDRWYGEGAKQVLAFGSTMTRALAIELPDDPVKRKTFIDYAEQWRKENERGKPPVTDVGQKYVIIRFL